VLDGLFIPYRCSYVSETWNENHSGTEATTDRRYYLCSWVTLHRLVLQYNLRKLEHWPKLSLCSYKSFHISQSVPRRQTFQYFIVCKVLDGGLNVHKAMFYWDKVHDDHFMCDVNFSRPGLRTSPYRVVWRCVVL
jgi:hypothetical protein